MGAQGVNLGREPLSATVFSIMLYPGRGEKDVLSEETWIKSEVTGKENQAIERLRANKGNGEKKDPVPDSSIRADTTCEALRCVPSCPVARGMLAKAHHSREY